MIRDINEKDIDTLSDVYYQTRLQVFDWMESDDIHITDFVTDTAEEKIWVAEVNGTVVGFISAYVPENFIHHLYILPKFSGINLGSQLLQTCLNHLGRPATLKCISANTKALHFYQSRGWQTKSIGISNGNEYQLMQINKS